MCFQTSKKKLVINFSQIKLEKKQKWKSLSSYLCLYLN